ncbi:MAG: zinc ribbon domain-containing protein [Muribaculaceae bacterium]|nr:zinc ribbon domain-containing protein [Muribaculaceae bacterium]
MAFCTNCGAPIEEGAKFCGQCGTPTQKVNNPQPTQQSAQQTQQYQQPVQQPYQQPAQQPYQQPAQQQYYQQPYQQPQQYQQLQQYQQPVAKFVPPTYPAGTPVLTFIWEGTRGSMDAIQNLGSEKIAKKVGTSQINIFVNGQPIAPAGALNWHDSFRIEVPITSNNIHIMIKTKSWFSKTMEFNFIIDPRYSYDVVLTEPSILAQSFIMGMNVLDKSGALHYSIGNPDKQSQWLSFLIPFIGFYYAFATPEGKESKVSQKLYLLAAITNLVIVAIILFEIFKK